MRTTIDVDGSVLAELRRRQREENKTLGQVASELLAKALAETDPEEPVPLVWTSGRMSARVDLEDRDSVQGLIDADR